MGESLNQNVSAVREEPALSSAFPGSPGVGEESVGMDVWPTTGGVALRGHPIINKVLFGSLFVVVIPLGLLMWTRLLDRTYGWAVPRWSGFALAVVVAGTALMLMAMIHLSFHGRGLPMSAYPPTQFVSAGVYRLCRHPIYLGAALVCLGLSLLTRSGGGLYVATPILIAAMIGYVLGYEKPGLDDRFGDASRDHQPLISLPPATSQKASWPAKLALTLTALAIWLLVGSLIDFTRCGETCTSADGALFSSWNPRQWSMIWVVPALLLVLRLLTSRTDSELRRAVIAAFSAVFVGLYLYGVLPTFALDVRAADWQLVLTGVVFVGAMSYRQVWDTLRRFSEAVANSRRDFLVYDGRFRIINHAIYSGLAGAAGVGVAGVVLGNGLAALILAVFLLIGAAVFAQGLWANTTTLLRPFGYWGGVLGSAAGVVAVHLFFGEPLARMALAGVLTAPLIQSIGRLRCLAQGCCHGIETGVGQGIRVWQPQSRVVTISGLRGKYVLPTQLYSILFNIALGIFLLALYLSASVSSTFIIGLYFVLTGIERFAEDAYRGEKQTRWAGPLRENQWFAVAAVVIGVATTVLPSEIPTGPDYGVAPLLLLAMVAGGLATAFTMSMDFPNSTLRYSRLSG
ncbi:MAG: prolipoprotein diacylglyceryl transferase family protein [Thermomicrobiales bacterium]